MTSTLRAALAATLAALLAACAATPTVQDVTARAPAATAEVPVSANLAQYRLVQVIVDAPEHVRKVDGYASASDELLNEFINAVRATGKYSAVGTTSEGNRMLVAKLTINELNHVSGAARGTVGVLAGRAVLRVTMTLSDKRTTETLATITAGHASSHLQGVFSPTTSRQVTAIAKELASKL